MSRPIYAMDTCFFHELGDYPLGVRCEMAKELGFEGSYLTLWTDKDQAWKDLEKFGEESSRNGLSPLGIYVTLDLDDVRERDRVLKLIPALPAGCNLEISLISSKAFKDSSEAGDEAALRLLQPLLDAVDPARNQVCLYAHIRQWLGRHQDSIRLIRKSGHPALGWVFSCFHWYASQEGRLLPLLDEGIPHLRRVNFCGTRRPTGGVHYTLEPLDSGLLDISVIFGQIVKRGYAGPIGIQGYSVGGDVYGRLKLGLGILREWDERFARHPHWADILPIPFPSFCAPGRAPLLVS